MLVNRTRLFKLISISNNSYSKWLLAATTAPNSSSSSISKFYSSNSTTSEKKKEGGCCKVAPQKQELGQPTYWTHPHLFDAAATTSNDETKNQQVTPGIKKDEFEQRRDTYVRHLLSYQTIYFSSKINRQTSSSGIDLNQLDHNFIAIIPSAMPTFMAPDVPHTFKQNSDFLYLTGFREPNSVLVISRTDINLDPNSYKCALFVEDNNEETKLWSGPRTPPSMIDKLCGIKYAYNINDLGVYLKSLVKESRNRQMTLWRYPAQNVRQESGPNCINEPVEMAIDEFVREESTNKLINMAEQEDLNGSASASYFNSSRYFVQLCRFKKSPAEIDLLRRSCDIASEALINAMQISHPYINEHLIYAKFEFDCRTRGAEYLSYIPVVAGGSRATVLHYIRNNQLIEPNQLVLMDAGCQYRDYSSDITRTWPVGGRYSRAQKQVYQACLNIQEHCLKHCEPGMQLGQLYNVMMRKLSEELVNLGVIEKQEHDLIMNNNAKTSRHIPVYYMKKLMNYCAHDIGHYLGMDIHDCPEMAKQMKFEKGTVITVEPGIYIRPDDETAPAHLRGIGVRIEDDVLITENGHEILSKKCPKTVDEIESILMKGC